MFNADMLSKKVAFKIANELKLDNDNKEVISYGVFAIIQMFYNLLLVILFGAVFNIVIEALIASFAISILRKSSGGAHASSAKICAIVGTFITIIIGLISKININVNSTIIIGVIIFIWAYYIIFKLAPVDSVAKPIRTEKKRKRLKRSSIFILSIYLIIVIVSIVLYLYTKIDRLLIYSICILGGVIWQVLSLTKIGHEIVKIIDAFLNKIIPMGIKGEKKNAKNE
ncbi:accessory gene regulator B family protein [Clostridium gasigenes]|uniref:accessory gene regulator ArgB-like protein n=1 Tax=Clostridium gasigenes TaxID=94869 RepID=UPI001628D665|nr:accessory gene regulator B family protein [Clostridium gasigenes]MBB6622296.1 accessory gene regulator B family protein [Clostridium gasigenes]MBU3087076.1 accessory gene regulator B family protein [Clostridium gasigenes]